MTAFALLRAAPRGLWWTAAVLLVLLSAWRWHEAKLAAAFGEGSRQQAAADTARFEAAATAAAAAQAALVARLGARQTAITKRTTDALDNRNDDLARRFDDLRLRWAAYHASQRSAGADGATGVSGAAGGVAQAACATAGWVSFETAAAAAEAADRAIAKDDAWIAWTRAQAEAWPAPE